MVPAIAPHTAPAIVPTTVPAGHCSGCFEAPAIAPLIAPAIAPTTAPRWALHRCCTVPDVAPKIWVLCSSPGCFNVPAGVATEHECPWTLPWCVSRATSQNSLFLPKHPWIQTQSNVGSRLLFPCLPLQHTFRWVDRRFQSMPLSTRLRSQLRTGLARLLPPRTSHAQVYESRHCKCPLSREFFVPCERDLIPPCTLSLFACTFR